MYVWPADVAFFSGYSINGEVFLLSIEDGIRKVEGDSLVLFIEKDLFGNMPVMDMIADQEERVLLLTISGELKTFSESKGVADFHDPLVYEYLRTNEPLDMLRLPDQRIAISTIRGGVIIINQNGTPDQIIHPPTDLQEVRDLYLDRQNGLWMAMDEGIARVELYLPYSFWGKSQGLNGGVTEVIFAHNRLYIGNRKGIFRQEFDQTGYTTSTFSFIPGSPGAFSDMELHEDTLFTGAANSLNKMLADGTISGGMQLPIIQLHAYEKNPGFLMIGFQDGMGVLEQQADTITWEFTSHFPEFTTDAASFAEDPSGALWVGSAYNGVRRFMISDFRKMKDTSRHESNPYLIDLKPEIRFYGTNKGVPKGRIKVFQMKESTWIATEKGLRRFDEETDRFVWEPAMNLDSSFQIIDVAVSKFGNLWILLDEHGSLDIWRANQSADGNFEWKKNQISRILHSDPPTYLYPDPNDSEILWIGTKNGLYQYDEETHKPDSFVFSASVREVKLLNEDSALVEKVNLPYSSNSLRFRFAAPSFSEPEKTVYQYYLEGFDSDWSEWTDKSEKEYTNLPERNYSFRVRAKDVEGNISEEGVWQFRVLPPWYRTWWAFILYGVIGFGLVSALMYGYNWWRIQKLEEKNQELENLIDKRTQEIQEKNLQLADSLDHLQKTQQQLILQEKMASLGQVTMGIAHEVKNPLNFVNNYAQVSIELADELEEEFERFLPTIAEAERAVIKDIIKDLRENATVIRKNGQRADNIVSSMRNHANDNQGQRAEVSVNELIKEQVQLAYYGYKSHEPYTPVHFEYNLTDDLSSIEVNPQEIGRVIINLVSNACYALNEKSNQGDDTFKPLIHIQTHQINQYQEIIIRDNGTGISQDNLAKIFQPFFTTKPTGQGNTGLGLSISYDIIVQGHQGKLTVDSVEGEYTEFVVVLPAKR
ncbi:MAG: ATP-binding protein [Bacteroidia bacterium]